MRRLILCFGFGFVVFAAVFVVWFLRCWSLRVFLVCVFLFRFVVVVFGMVFELHIAVVRVCLCMFS